MGHSPYQPQNIPLRATPQMLDIVGKIDYPLLPHQGRVVEEHYELCERIRAIDEFVRGDLFQRVDTAEATLLLTQLQVMRTLEFLLRSRVMLWAGEI